MRNRGAACGAEQGAAGPFPRTETGWPIEFLMDALVSGGRFPQYIRCSSQVRPWPPAAELALAVRAFGDCGLVPMRVVHVRHMRMGMSEPFVLVSMRVRLSRRIAGPVDMLVMVIMHMRMSMYRVVVNMVMLMTLGQMQPDAGRHEQARGNQLDRERLPKNNHGNGGAQERRN